MSELGLTDEEKDLVALLARDKASRGSHLGFYAAAIIPALVLGGFGILNKDLVALGLAFAVLLLFVGWRISQELLHLNSYVGVFKKVAAHEKHAEAHAQPIIPPDLREERAVR